MTLWRQRLPLQLLWSFLAHGQASLPFHERSFAQREAPFPAATLQVYPIPIRDLLKIKLPQYIHCGKFFGVNILFFRLIILVKKRIVNLKFQSGFSVVFLNILNLDIYLSVAYILSVNKLKNININVL